MNTLTPAVTPIALTTLSAAVTSAAQTVIQVASVTLTVGPYTTVTARNPQWGLMIDGEILAVVAVSGTTLTVARGQAGTQASLHASGAAVWAAPLNDIDSRTLATLPFQAQDLGYSTVPIGSVAYGSVGTDTTLVAGTMYLASVNLPALFACTGISVLNGGTAGSTNKGLVALYDANGNLVANSDLAGASIASTNVFQTRAFTPGPLLLPAGQYYIGFQSNGTTDKIRTVATVTYIAVKTTSIAGTFGTLPTLVVPTTFTADVGPIAYLY